MHMCGMFNGFEAGRDETYGYVSLGVISSES